jgi:hypothetical protein
VEDQTPSGRACGTCTLCCKLLGIAEIDKPRGELCGNCDVGRGCRVYASRPAECRDFYCAYLTHSAMGEHWFPDRCGMVVAPEFDGARIVIHVDAGHPDAWREQPYYADIKRWAAFAARDLGQVVVSIGDRSIVILPEEDVDLGIVADGECIVVGEAVESGRLRLRALKMRKDDPRLGGAQREAMRGPPTNPAG